MSAKELKKAWLSPKPRRKQARKQKKPKKITVSIAPPEMGDTVSLFFEARNCCVPKAKAGLDCRHDAVVVGLNSKMFKAKCTDGSKWDIVIMKKRTGLFRRATGRISLLLLPLTLVWSRWLRAMMTSKNTFHSFGLI